MTSVDATLAERRTLDGHVLFGTPARLYCIAHVLADAREEWRRLGRVGKLAANAHSFAVH